MTVLRAHACWSSIIPPDFERFLDEMQQLVARDGSKEERVALADRFDVIPVPTPKAT